MYRRRQINWTKNNYILYIAADIRHIASYIRQLHGYIRRKWKFIRHIAQYIRKTGLISHENDRFPTHRISESAFNLINIMVDLQ